jgi:hypothetical protein
MAFAISQGGWELAGVCSGLVTLTGVWLHWRSQWHLSDIEDAVKNGRISADEGQRRMRFVGRRAVVLIFGGLGLLAFTVLALSM